MSPKVLSSLKARMREVYTIFPGTNFACLIAPDGEVLAQDDGNLRYPEELLQHICSLKTAAEQFAATLQQNECPIIHLKGQNVMYSCYDIDSNMLTFYSNMDTVPLAVFNVAAADKKMQSVIQEIRLILTNAMTAS